MRKTEEILIGENVMKSMKIKQQRQIKRFLSNEFGEAGERYFQMQSEMLKNMTVRIKGKTENQKRTLCRTILPRIALYKVLLDERPANEEAIEYMRKYMLDFVAAQKHASTAKMELFPGFYFIYSRIFLKIMRTTDLQISTQKCGKNFYDITITKCLWHTACIENGCEELCALFCDVDDVTYGGLSKIGFSRTQTLGYGGKCCDFHFYKKGGKK